MFKWHISDRFQEKIHLNIPQIVSSFNNPVSINLNSMWVWISLSSPPQYLHALHLSYIANCGVLYTHLLRETKPLPPNLQTSLSPLCSPFPSPFIQEKMSHTTLYSECHPHLVLSGAQVLVPDPLAFVSSMLLSSYWFDSFPSAFKHSEKHFLIYSSAHTSHLFATVILKFKQCRFHV